MVHIFIALRKRLPALLAAFLVTASVPVMPVPGIAAETDGDPLEQIASDFETGTAEGWTGRGANEVLSAAAEAAHTGSYGLKVTGRTSGWNGPQLSLSPLPQAGGTYAISAWLRLPDGSPDSTIDMTVQRTTDGTTHYEKVTSGTVTAGEWVKLEGEYDMLYAAESFAVYFEASAAPTLDFYMDDFALQREPAAPPAVIQEYIPSLKDVFADQFMLGAAFVNSEIADEDGPDAQLLLKHFNAFTPGNALKWDSTEPAEGEFNFTESDKAVQFGVDHGVPVRGHTLVWHSQAPDWIFYDANGSLASKELLLQRLKSHIETEVGRYKGKIYAWDVINEVIDPAQPNGMRNSLWYQIAGEEYIEKAFEYAHEADPDAKLFINDYNTHDPDKAQYLYDLIKRLQEKGVPIDGVGHQMHISVTSPSIGQIEETIEKFKDLGIEQQITELDMSSYANDTDSWQTYPLSEQMKQAYRYRDLFDMLRRHADDLTAVIFWGKDDANSWLRTYPVVRNNWPLLFDEQLQAKLAYWGLVDPSVLPVEMKQAKAAEGSPKVDGRTELDWEREPYTSIYRDGSEAARFKALWSEDKLYVLADVYQTEMYDSDTVELFVDENNGKTASYEADDRHYILARSSGKKTEDADYKVKTIDGGYRVEASVPIAQGSLGKELGFDIRIVSGEAGDEWVSWNDTTGSQNSDTSKFGTLLLNEGVQLAQAAYGTPVVDAVYDEVWSRTEPFETGRWVIGSSGATAEVRTLWDDGHLYVWAEVTDSFLSKESSNAYEQDSIELFVDPNNGRTELYEDGDGQYRINYDNEQSYNPAALTGSMVSATRLTDSGYIVEASIELDPSFLKKDGLLGFDIQVNNDEDGDGDRDSVSIWNDTSGNSYMNTALYGLLELKKKIK